MDDQRCSLSERGTDNRNGKPITNGGNGANGINGVNGERDEMLDMIAGAQSCRLNEQRLSLIHI